MSYRTKLANAAHDYELGVKTAAITLDSVKGLVSSAKQRAKDIAHHLSGASHIEQMKALADLQSKAERRSRSNILAHSALASAGLLGHHLLNRRAQLPHVEEEDGAEALERLAGSRTPLVRKSGAGRHVKVHMNPSGLLAFDRRPLFEVEEE